MIKYIYEPKLVESSIQSEEIISPKPSEIRLYYLVKRYMVNEYGDVKPCGYASNLDGCDITVEGNADYTNTTFNPYNEQVCLHISVFQTFEFTNQTITVTVADKGYKKLFDEFKFYQEGVTEDMLKFESEDKMKCETANGSFSYGDAHASGGTLCPSISYKISLGGQDYSYSVSECNKPVTSGDIDIIFICCALSLINNKSGIVRVPSKKNIISERTIVGNVQALVYINGKHYETLCTDVYQGPNRLISTNDKKYYLDLSKNRNKIPKGGTNGGLVITAETQKDVLRKYTSGYEEIATVSGSVAHFNCVDEFKKEYDTSKIEVETTDTKTITILKPNIGPNLTKKDIEFTITAIADGLSKSVTVIQKGTFDDDDDEPEDNTGYFIGYEYEKEFSVINFNYKFGDGNYNTVPAEGTNGTPLTLCDYEISLRKFPVYQMTDGSTNTIKDRPEYVDTKTDTAITVDSKIECIYKVDDSVVFDTDTIIKDTSNDKTNEIVVCKVQFDATVKVNGEEIRCAHKLPLVVDIKQPSVTKKKIYNKPDIIVSYLDDAGNNGGEESGIEPHVVMLCQTYHYEGSDTYYYEYNFGGVLDTDYVPVKLSEFPWPEGSQWKISFANYDSDNVEFNESTGKIWAKTPNEKTTRQLLSKPVTVEYTSNGITCYKYIEAYQAPKDLPEIGFKFSESNPEVFEVGRNASLNTLTLSVEATDDEEYALDTYALGKLDSGSYFMLRLWNAETRIYAPDKFCAFYSNSWLTAKFIFDFDKDTDIHELGTGKMYYTAYVCDDETGKNFSPITYKDGHQFFGEIKFILPDKIDITVNNFNSSSLQITDNGSPGRTAKSMDVSILSAGFTLRYDGTVRANEIVPGRNAFMEFTNADAYSSNAYFNTEGKGYMIFQNLSFVNKSPAFVMSNLNTWIYFEWYSEKYGNKKICCRAPLYMCKYNGSTPTPESWTLKGNEESGIHSNTIGSYWMVTRENMPDVTSTSGNGTLPKIVTMRMQTYSNADGLYVDLTESIIIFMRNMNGNTNFTTVS